MEQGAYGVLGKCLRNDRLKTSAEGVVGWFTWLTFVKVLKTDCPLTLCQCVVK